MTPQALVLALVLAALGTPAGAAPLASPGGAGQASANGSIRGRVLDGVGRVSAGAVVEARPGSTGLITQVVTDDQGRFELVLPAGPVQVHAHDPASALVWTADLTVVAGAQTTVGVRLRAGCTLAGRVQTDATTRVAGELELSTAADGDEPGARFVAVGLVGPDGRFRWRGDEAGAVVVRVRGASGAVSTTRAAVCADGVVVDDLVVSLGHEPLAAAGQLLGPDGQPVAGARVHLTAGSGERIDTLTDGGGRWRLTPSDGDAGRAGQVQLEALGADGGWATQWVTLPVAGQVLHLRAPGRVRLELRGQRGPVTLVLLACSSGDPARYQIAPAGSRLVELTAVPACLHELRLETADRVEVRAVDVGAGATLELAVDLTPGPERLVSGRVQGADGGGLAGVTVHDGGAPGRRRSTVSGADGRFTLRTQRAELVAESPGWRRVVELGQEPSPGAVIIELGR